MNEVTENIMKYIEQVIDMKTLIQLRSSIEKSLIENRQKRTTKRLSMAIQNQEYFTKRKTKLSAKKCKI